MEVMASNVMNKLLICILMLALLLPGCEVSDPSDYTRPDYPTIKPESDGNSPYQSLPIICTTLEEYEAFLQNTYHGHETFVHYEDIACFGEFVEYWAGLSEDAEHVHERQHYVLREPNGNQVYFFFAHYFDKKVVPEQGYDMVKDRRGGYEWSRTMPEVENFLLFDGEEPVASSGYIWYGNLCYRYHRNSKLSPLFGLYEVSWINGGITGINGGATAKTLVFISAYPRLSGDTWTSENVDLTDETSLLVQLLDPERAEAAAKKVAKAVSLAYWKNWMQKWGLLVAAVLCAAITCIVLIVIRNRHIKRIQQFDAKKKA